MTPPADSGTPRRVTVTFDPRNLGSARCPSSISVEFADASAIATTAPSGDEQGERAHGDGTTAQCSSQGESGGRA